MVFHIIDHVYLPFWLAAWNAAIFWHAMEEYSRRVPNGISQNTLAASFIRKMPLHGKWKEVTITLRHLTLCREECASYSYRGLVEFLQQAERYVEHLGLTSRQRNAAAVQLIQTKLIQPAVSQHLPTTVAQRNQVELHQMRRLFAEMPQAARYKRVAVMWVCWMDAYGAYYPRGWQATILKMEELVDEMPNIEYTPTPIIQELSAPTKSEGSNEPATDNPAEEDSSGDD